MVTTGMEMAMASGRFLKEEPKTEGRGGNFLLSNRKFCFARVATFSVSPRQSEGTEVCSVSNQSDLTSQF